MRKENEIYCNMCGRKLEKKEDILREDVLSVKKNWGYFSGRDGEIHEFDLCETCYDRLIKQFRLPVTQTEQKEML
ncbi:MAG: hypothetical protein Q4C50_09480 [Eubacteriales bacterium]|nr:hypothetical protein [Eubacteriales bacterium]